MKKFIPRTLIVAGFLTAGGFAGCHSFSTVQGPIKDNRVKGLIYYLPKGQIRITGDFKSGGGGGGAAAAAKSTTAGSAELSAVAAGGPSGADSAEQKNFVVTIAADIEADPKARYYLKPVRNYFYDDDIKLSVNPKHLLSTGNATAEDQTARIISTAASMAAQAAGVPGGRVPAFAPTPPDTVNGLLLVIQVAISKQKAALDTTLPSAALFELPNAFPSNLPRPPEAEAFRNLLMREDFVSLGMLMKLLKLYPPERPIDLSEAKDFWTQLIDALSGAARRQKYVQPRPFSIVFDPATHGTPIGTPWDVPVCDPNDCGLTVTITEETQQPEMASKLKTIWEGKNKDTAHGIAFRALKPYRVTVKSVGTSNHIDENRLVLLPDTRPEHTLVLDYSRLAFVKKTTNIGFVDGVPQNLAQTAPSSVLGFLAIPKGIIQAIVPLPPAVTGAPGGVQAPGTSGTTGAPSPAPASSPGGL